MTEHVCKYNYRYLQNKISFIFNKYPVFNILLVEMFSRMRSSSLLMKLIHEIKANNKLTIFLNCSLKNKFSPNILLNILTIEICLTCFRIFSLINFKMF